MHAAAHLLSIQLGQQRQHRRLCLQRRPQLGIIHPAWRGTHDSGFFEHQAAPWNTKQRAQSEGPASQTTGLATLCALVEPPPHLTVAAILRPSSTLYSARALRTARTAACSASNCASALASTAASADGQGAAISAAPSWGVACTGARDTAGRCWRNRGEVGLRDVAPRMECPTNPQLQGPCQACCASQKQQLASCLPCMLQDG